MKFLRTVKIFLIFSLLISIFTACEVSWFGDIKNDLEKDTNSIISFYAQPLEKDSDAQCITISVSISTVISEKDFPSKKMDPVKAGYHVDYWRYYRDHNSLETEAPDTVSFDSKIKDKVVSIKVTPQYCDFYAMWAPNTDTPYQVEHYFQNLTLDDYELDSSRTQILNGTTDTLTSASSLLVTGFEAQHFEQANINGDESTVIKIYYNRIPSVVEIDYSNGAGPVEIHGYYGQTITELSIPDRTDEGYNFSKWDVTYEDGTKTTSTDSFIVFKELKAAYKAVWSERVYTITWDMTPRGGIVAASWTGNFKPVTEFTVSTGCEIPFSENISRRGYTFDGWYTDIGYTTPAESWINGRVGDVTFYAKWTPVTYTITYVVNEGTLDGTEQLTYTIEDTVTMPGITRTGMLFKGWYISSAFTGTAVTGWGEGDRNEDITLYAKWEEIPYTITWKTNPEGRKVLPQWATGYTAKTSYTITTGCTLPASTNISRRGYTFGGWYTDASYTTPAESWTNGRTGDVTFYAKWTPVTYTITYVVNEGTLDETQQLTYTIEDTVRMPGITRTGWRFNGWFETAAFTGSALSGWSEGDRNKNTTVYAKWTEINSQIGGVTITYPVESDKNLELAVSYMSGTDTWTYSATSGFTDYKWFLDSSQLDWTGNSGSNVILGITIEPGYHNLLVVTTDAAGNEYSAAAVIRVIK